MNVSLHLTHCFILASLLLPTSQALRLPQLERDIDRKVELASHWQQAFENRGPSSLGKIYAEFILGAKVSSPFTDWINVLSTAAKHWSLNNYAIEKGL
jgi:hypothetical protein